MGGRMKLFFSAITSRRQSGGNGWGSEIEIQESRREISLPRGGKVGRLRAWVYRKNKA